MLDLREMQKLKKKLSKRGIKYWYGKTFTGGRQITTDNISCICSLYSAGNEAGLLEVKYHDIITGYLTANEAFAFFKNEANL